MNGIKLSLLILATLLAAPAAESAPNGARRRGGAPAAASPADDAKKAATPEKSMEEVCKPDYIDDPFKPNEPFPPTSAGSVPTPVDYTAITSAQERELQFDNQHCNDVRAGSVANERPLCDGSFGRIARSYHLAKKSLKEGLEKVCHDIKEAKAGCATQADTQECMSKIYRDAAGKLDLVANGLKTVKEQLKTLQNAHKRIVTREKNRIYATPSPTLASTAGFNLARYQQKIKTLENELNTGVYANRASQISDCRSKVSDALFCAHVGAGTDDLFWAKLFELQFQKTDKVAKALTAVANVAANRGEQTGSGDGGGGGGGGGLDTLMKMATLGMGGAGLYCSMTGKCSQKQETPANPMDPNQSAATSPTPTATNPASTQFSSTGEKSQNPPGGVGIGGPAGPVVDAASNPGERAFGGDSGFSSHSSNEEKPGVNNASRAPAASGPAGGGGGGGGGGDGGGSLHPEAKDAALHDSGKGFEALGNGGGGPASPGAFSAASPGGFNLGDAHNPTDAALKDILNGDSPTGTDSALLGLDGLDGAGHKQSADGLGFEDPESLFSRVQRTHVRCLKRGCVGREVGENI